jgi:hypothetical protein
MARHIFQVSRGIIDKILEFSFEFAFFEKKTLERRRRRYDRPTTFLTQVSFLIVDERHHKKRASEIMRTSALIDVSSVYRGSQQFLE